MFVIFRSTSAMVPSAISSVVMSVPRVVSRAPAVTWRPVPVMSVSASPPIARVETKVVPAVSVSPETKKSPAPSGTFTGVPSPIVTPPPGSIKRFAVDIIVLT